MPELLQLLLAIGFDLFVIGLIIGWLKMFTHTPRQ